MMRLREIETRAPVTLSVGDSPWWWDEVGEDNSLRQTVGPLIEGTIESAGGAALAEMSASIRFDVYSHIVQDHIRRRVARITRVNDTTRRHLQQEIAAGDAAGETIEQIPARVAAVYQRARDYRTERIARTEVVGAHNYGALEGYRQSGVVQYKEWLAGPGARATHAEADGQVVGLEEMFRVGDCLTDTPGNSGCPEEDINCQCAIAPVVRSAEREEGE